VTIGRVDVDGGAQSIAVEVLDFETFFARHHGEMVRALTLALGDAELARDASAEGFARALQRWSKVSTYVNPSGWVYRVGLNWARSRHRKRRRERVGAVAERAAPPESPRDVELIEAISQLTFDHRCIVVGRYYLDWSEAQLADVFDVAPGTVKSRLSRALAHLASLLEDDHDRV
jgi:RNA polymerase sigma-70 factor (ECF subfamily)